MPRSVKHTTKFKYTRHLKAFEGMGNNMREAGNFMRELLKKHQHVEIQSPKCYTKLVAVAKERKEIDCVSVRYYTRKAVGQRQPAGSVA